MCAITIAIFGTILGSISDNIKNGRKYNWKAWYEPYARDWYWIGPQVGTHNPMERQELNHLILNTDAVASEGDFELPFVNEGPEKVDPMDATTQPPSAGGDDTE